MPLTETRIKAIKPQSKISRQSDGNGLCVQVNPNGRKYWRFRYMFAGKEKMLASGTYPEVSLAEARERCHEARKSVAAGVDPSERKKQLKRLAIYKAANTFGEISREWFDTKKSGWPVDHASRIWRRLELHIFPELGNKPVADVIALEILDAIRKVEDRDNTEMSRRLLQTCTVKGFDEIG